MEQGGAGCWCAPLEVTGLRIGTFSGFHGVFLLLFPLANRPVLILWVFEASNLRSFILELCTNESGL